MLATAGSTVPLLRKVSVFGVRSGDGPQGIPINKSRGRGAASPRAASAGYRLEVAYGDREVALTRDELRGDAAATPDPADRLRRGLERQRRVDRRPGARPARPRRRARRPRRPTSTRCSSAGPFRHTVLQGNFADDDRTLLALALNGEPLRLDHGYPCRLIAPNRPGVLQTKWVARLEVVA